METVHRDLHTLRGCVLVEVEYTIKDIKDNEMSVEFTTSGRELHLQLEAPMHRGTQSKLEFHLY